VIATALAPRGRGVARGRGDLLDLLLDEEADRRARLGAAPALEHLADEDLVDELLALLLGELGQRQRVVERVDRDARDLAVLVLLVEVDLLQDEAPRALESTLADRPRTGAPEAQQFDPHEGRP